MPCVCRVAGRELPSRSTVLLTTRHTQGRASTGMFEALCLYDQLPIFQEECIINPHLALLPQVADHIPVQC